MHEWPDLPRIPVTFRCEHCSETLQILESHMVGEPQAIRSSMLVVCPSCGVLYERHTYSPHARARAVPHG